MIIKDLEIGWGRNINQAIDYAIEKCKEDITLYKFEFNSVTVIVSGGSVPNLIYRDWNRAMNGYLGKNATVGPFPDRVLSESQLERDNKIKLINEENYMKQQKEWAEEARVKSQKLKAKLNKCSDIEISNYTSWNKTVDANKDGGYGEAIIRYAEKWAKLMQCEIANGKSIKECADETSHLADDEGITGFMYGCAVSILAECWKHGEELRRWHNSKTQIGTEGDRANENGSVLNPACLSINLG